MIDRQGLQDCQLTHQLDFRDPLNGQPNGLFAALRKADQYHSLRIKTKGDTRLSQSASRGSIDSDLHQSTHSSERRGTSGPGRGTCIPSPERVTPLPIQDGRIVPSEWPRDRLPKVVCERVRDWADGGEGPLDVHPDWPTSQCERCRFVRAALEPSSEGRVRSMIAWSVGQRLRVKRTCMPSASSHRCNRVGKGEGVVLS